jgi:DNA invertase Pin-like site-specific DNA recombinase
MSWLDQRALDKLQQWLDVAALDKLNDTHNAKFDQIAEFVYCDNDISASTKSTKPRPDFDRMLADLRSGRIDAVTCLSLDRLTRRVIEGVSVFAIFAELGVAYADSKGSDTTTAAGRGHIHGDLSRAQEEAETISERVDAAIIQRRESRLADPMASVLGFQHRTFLEHVEPEADLIREMYKMAFAGSSIREIGAYCRSTGITGKGARDSWIPSQVHCVLRRAANAGLLKVGGELATAENIKPIVKVKLWRDVQEIMDERTGSPRKGRQDYLMSGMVWCECGARMRASASRKTSRGYTSTPLWTCRRDPDSNAACGRNSRSMPLIEAIVDAYMQAAIAGNTLIVEPATVDNTERIAGMVARIAHLQEAVAAGDADIIDVTPILRKLRADIGALERAQESSVLQSAAQRSAAELDQAKVWASDGDQAVSARRAILKAYVGSVVVSRMPGKVTLADGGPGRKAAQLATVAIIPA